MKKTQVALFLFAGLIASVMLILSTGAQAQTAIINVGANQQSGALFSSRVVLLPLETQLLESIVGFKSR
jgi:hypothetical protein